MVQIYAKVSAKTRGNHISGLALPNRILHYTNITKGECKGKRKSYFRFDYAEPHHIFYKYNERRVEKKELALFFYRATSHFRISHKNSDK